jgi:hypothetical protein
MRSLLGGWCCLALLSCANVSTAQSGSVRPGPQLPKPWGVGVTFYDQSQPYGLESLRLNLPGIDPSVASSLDVDNTTETEHVTFDRWLLPFLNVQVLIGRLETRTDIKLSALNIGVPLSDLSVRTSGLVYGCGATLAYGTGRAFGTLTAQYTGTHLDEEGAAVRALVLTPKLGVKVHERAAVHVGAMYQRPTEEHSGQYPVPPFGTVAYSVKVTSADRWNYLAGVDAGLGSHWLLTAEGGFGKRHAVLLHLDYRW